MKASTLDWRRCNGELLYQLMIAAMEPSRPLTKPIHEVAVASIDLSECAKHQQPSVCWIGWELSYYVSKHRYCTVAIAARLVTLVQV